MSKKTKALAEEWIDRAASDVKYARAGERETGQHHITCFLCHQAAEKALKGLIALDGKAPQKTHSLGLLMTAAAASYPSLMGIIKDVRRLDKFYIPARYPGGEEFDFEPRDAEAALATAEHLLTIARSELAESGK